MIPTYDQFIEPLLRYLGEQNAPVSTRDAHEAVADRVGLSAEAREALLPSGRQTVYKNRIGWANDRLKRSGYSSSPRRAMWQITDQGRAFLAAHASPLTLDEVHEIANVDRSIRLREPDESDDEPVTERRSPSVRPPEPDATQSPDERIEAALEELNDSVAAELLEQIGTASPTFFEHLVLDLLHRMGYGASRADLKRVGGSGDGGIDGIISLDRLGLEKVYVQAKRWKDSVGRPEIQAFFGALAGHRAKKGVFITTSHYSRAAEDYATQVSDSIVLVDGHRLAKLLIEHGVGVTHRTLRIAELDSDYFEDG